MKLPKTLKVIALVTCIVFTTNTIVYSAPHAVYKIRVPEKFGKVVERWKRGSSSSFDYAQDGELVEPLIAHSSLQKEKTMSHEPSAMSNDNDRMVIIIEDAHENFGAQKNIAEIIQALIPQLKEYGVPSTAYSENKKQHAVPSTQYAAPLVGVEGAAGAVDVNHLRTFPIMRARKNASANLMQQGYLTGAESAAIVTPEPFTLYGVENEELFTQDFRAFHKIATVRPDIERFFVEMETAIAYLKQHVFNPELQTFDTLVADHAAGMMPFADYLNALCTYAEERDIDYADRTQFALFQEIVSLEAAIDADQLATEVARLRTTRGEEETNVEATAEELLSLWGRAEQTCSYPAMSRYVECQRKQALLDVSVLQREIAALSGEIKRSLAQNNDEQRLITIEVEIRLLKRILSLKATRADIRISDVRKKEAGHCEEPVGRRSNLQAQRLLRPCGARNDLGEIFVRQSKNTFSHMVTNLRTLSQKYNLNLVIPEQSCDFAGLITTAQEFYHLAEQREQAMVDNLLEKMEAEDTQCGVLVAGGYHTAGVTDILREKNISYLTIRPHIEDVYDKAGFMDRMLGNLVPLTPHLTSYITTSYLSGLLEMVCEAGYKEQLLALFEGDWTTEIVNDHSSAALLKLLENDPGIIKEIQHKAPHLYQVAFEKAVQVGTEKHDVRNTTAIIKRVQELVNQEKALDAVIERLGIAQPRTQRLTHSDLMQLDGRRFKSKDGEEFYIRVRVPDTEALNNITIEAIESGSDVSDSRIGPYITFDVDWIEQLHRNIITAHWVTTELNSYNNKGIAKSLLSLIAEISPVGTTITFSTLPETEEIIFYLVQAAGFDKREDTELGIRDRYAFTKTHKYSLPHSLEDKNVDLSPPRSKGEADTPSSDETERYPTKGVLAVDVQPMQFECNRKFTDFLNALLGKTSFTIGLILERVVIGDKLQNLVGVTDLQDKELAAIPVYMLESPDGTIDTSVLQHVLDKKVPEHVILGGRYYKGAVRQAFSALLDYQKAHGKQVSYHLVGNQIEGAEWQMRWTHERLFLEMAEEKDLTVAVYYNSTSRTKYVTSGKKAEEADVKLYHWGMLNRFGNKIADKEIAGLEPSESPRHIINTRDGKDTHNLRPIWQFVAGIVALLSFFGRKAAGGFFSVGWEVYKANVAYITDINKHKVLPRFRAIVRAPFRSIARGLKEDNTINWNIAASGMPYLSGIELILKHLSPRTIHSIKIHEGETSTYPNLAPIIAEIKGLIAQGKQFIADSRFKRGFYEKFMSLRFVRSYESSDFTGAQFDSDDIKSLLRSLLKRAYSVGFDREEAVEALVEFAGYRYEEENKEVSILSATTVINVVRTIIERSDEPAKTANSVLQLLQHLRQKDIKLDDTDIQKIITSVVLHSDDLEEMIGVLGRISDKLKTLGYGSDEIAQQLKTVTYMGRHTAAEEYLSSLLMGEYDPADNAMKKMVRCIARSRATGKILLLPSLDPERDLERWKFPGGDVEPGETIEDAARRILEEKTSLEAQIFSICNMYEPQIHTWKGERIGVYYVIFEVADEDDGEWVSKDKLREHAETYENGKSSLLGTSRTGLQYIGLPSPLEFFLSIMQEWKDSIRTMLAEKSFPFIFGWGSARLQPDDAAYKKATETGTLVARAGYSGATGAGRAIMEAYNLGIYGEDGVKSVGLPIKLPFEEEPNEYLDVVTEFQYFFIRILAFILPSAGGFAFTGGYGTMQEIFELLAFNIRNPGRERPIVLEKPFFDSLEAFLKKGYEEGFITQKPDELITLRETPAAMFAALKEKIQKIGLTPEQVRKQLEDFNISWMTYRLLRADRLLRKHKRNVAIIGSKNTTIDSENKYYTLARDIALSFNTIKGAAVLRWGNTGIGQAVGDAYQILKEGGGTQNNLYFSLNEVHEREGDDIRSTQFAHRQFNFNYHTALRVALLRHSTMGMIFLPGDIDTYDMFFEALCLMQTKKAPRVPLVLVGREYHRDVIEWIRKKFVGRTIKAKDLDLIKVADTAEEAWDIIVDFALRNNIITENDIISVAETESHAAETPDSMAKGAEELFLDGRIYDPAIIRRERAIAAKRPTVIFDLNETIAVPLLAKDFGGQLEPNIVQQLRLLRDNGVRLVLWTDTTRGLVESFLYKFPDLINLFDLVITGYNYATAGQAEELIPALEAAGVKDAKAAASRYISDLGVQPKDVSLLFGTKALLVDDYEGIHKQAQLSSTGRFLTHQVISFSHPDDVLDDRHNLARDILQKLAAVHPYIDFTIPEKVAKPISIHEQYIYNIQAMVAVNRLSQQDVIEKLAPDRFFTYEFLESEGTLWEVIRIEETDSRVFIVARSLETGKRYKLEVLENPETGTFNGLLPEGYPAGRPGTGTFADERLPPTEQLQSERAARLLDILNKVPSLDECKARKAEIARKIAADEPLYDDLDVARLSMRDTRSLEALPLVLIKTDDLLFCDALLDTCVVDTNVGDSDALFSGIPFATCTGLVVKGEKEGKTVLAYAQLQDDEDGLKGALRSIHQLGLVNPYFYFDIEEGEKKREIAIDRVMMMDEFAFLTEAKQQGRFTMRERKYLATRIVATKDGIIIQDEGENPAVMLWDDFPTFVLGTGVSRRPGDTANFSSVRYGDGENSDNNEKVEGVNWISVFENKEVTAKNGVVYILKPTISYSDSYMTSIDVQLIRKEDAAVSNPVLRFTIVEHNEILDFTIDLEDVLFNQRFPTEDLRRQGIGKQLHIIFGAAVTPGTKLRTVVTNQETINDLLLNYDVDEHGNVQRSKDGYSVVDRSTQEIRANEVSIQTITKDTIFGHLMTKAGFEMKSIKAYGAHNTEALKRLIEQAKITEEFIDLKFELMMEKRSSDVSNDNDTNTDVANDANSSANPISRLGNNPVRLKSGAHMYTPLDDDTIEKMRAARKTQHLTIDAETGQAAIVPRLPMDLGWENWKTPLKIINEELDVDLVQIIITEVTKMKESNDQQQPYIVVDWGCGNGVALNTIACSLPDDILPYVRLIGFGNMYAPEWERAHPSITFILDDAINFDTYFEIESINLMYSYIGLHGLPLDIFVKVMPMIEPLIHAHGLIIFNAKSEIRTGIKTYFKHQSDVLHIETQKSVPDVKRDVYKVRPENYTPPGESKKGSTASSTPAFGPGTFSEIVYPPAKEGEKVEWGEYGVAADEPVWSDEFSQCLPFVFKAQNNALLYHYWPYKIRQKVTERILEEQIEMVDIVRSAIKLDLYCEIMADVFTEIVNVLKRTNPADTDLNIAVFFTPYSLTYADNDAHAIIFQRLMETLSNVMAKQWQGTVSIDCCGITDPQGEAGKSLFIFPPAEVVDYINRDAFKERTQVLRLDDFTVYPDGRITIQNVFRPPTFGLKGTLEFSLSQVGLQTFESTSNVSHTECPHLTVPPYEPLSAAEITEKINTLHDLVMEEGQQITDLDPRYVASIEKDCRCCIVNVGNYHQTVERLIVWMGLGSWYVELKDKLLEVPAHLDIEKLPDPDIEMLIVEIILALYGNEVEIVLPTVQQIPPSDKDSWNEDWKQQRPHIDLAYRDMYNVISTIIDTMIEQYFSEQEVTIADIGGHKGEFITYLYERLRQRRPTLEPHYWLIDSSPYAIEHAQKKLAGLKNITMYQQDAEAIATIANENASPPHIVTALGLLNSDIMKREDAINVATKVYAALPEGGFFLVTGYTRCLLRGEDYASIGFEILNTSVPINLLTMGMYPNELYILKKPLQVATSSAKTNDTWQCPDPFDSDGGQKSEDGSQGDIENFPNEVNESIRLVEYSALTSDEQKQIESALDRFASELGLLDQHGKPHTDVLKQNSVLAIREREVVRYLHYTLHPHLDEASVTRLEVNLENREKGVGRALWQYSVNNIFNSYATITSTSIELDSLGFWENVVGKQNLEPLDQELGLYQLNISNVIPNAKEPLSKQRNVMTLDEAYEFLSQRARYTEKDLELSRELAKELLHSHLNPSIEKIMVVGTGLVYLPVLLALTGKDVTFLDAEHTVPVGLITEVTKKRLRSLDTQIDLRLNFIMGEEIGQLDLEEYGIVPHSFDCITFIDLVGGIPFGSPEEWLYKAQELLKPKAYLVIDGDVVGRDTMAKYFNDVFPHAEMLARGIQGYYNLYRFHHENIFYRVQNVLLSVSERKEKATTHLIGGLHVRYEKGIAWRSYSALLMAVLGKLRRDYPGFFIELREKVTIWLVKEGETVDRKQDNIIQLSESFLKECLKDTPEGAQARTKLVNYIMPFAFTQESRHMDATLEAATQIFEEKLIHSFGRDSVANVLSSYNRQLLNQYLREVYWMWMYTMSFNFEEAEKEPEYVARERLFETLEQIQGLVADGKMKEIAQFFTELKEEDPESVFKAFIEPLAFIKNFVNAQSYTGVLKKATFNALDVVIKDNGGDGVDEFHAVSALVEGMVAEQEEFKIYIEPALRDSRGFELIERIIEHERERRKEQFAIRTVDNAAEADLVLAFDKGDEIELHKTFYFATDFDAFLRDVYLFSVFFDALLLKGWYPHNEFVWIQRISTIEFHETFMEYFDSAVFEGIKERLLRTAA